MEKPQQRFNVCVCVLVLLCVRNSTKKCIETLKTIIVKCAIVLPPKNIQTEKRFCGNPERLTFLSTKCVEHPIKQRKPIT